MRLRVQLTDEHIRRGIRSRGSVFTGPVAWAVRDAVGPPCTPFLAHRRPYVIARGRRWSCSFPAVARFLAACFDAGLPVWPLGFDMELVPSEQADEIGHGMRAKGEA